MSKKRDLLAELIEGFEALAEQRSGERTLENWEQGRAPAARGEWKLVHGQAGAAADVTA